MNRQRNSSWEGAASWYDSIVGDQGHFYHKELILPRLLEMMALQKGNKLLDLGCGQGILSRVIPKGVDYVGVDLSPSLIEKAKKDSPHTFICSDATKPLKVDNNFSHAAVILALQNMESPEGVFINASKALLSGGHLYVVINHPYFRIPRQTSWEVDEGKKLQYRRIDAYMSPMKIPIQMSPGKSKETTTSFHFSLSEYMAQAIKAGLVLTGMEEWCSPKISTGKKAKMENRARKEFPLFMALVFMVQ